MSWHSDYQHGTLLLLPPLEVTVTVNQLRKQYDYKSFNICTAHITLTQPLLSALTIEDKKPSNE